MRKLILSLTMTFMLAATTANAAPVEQFEKGTVNIAIGSALNSGVDGTGFYNGHVNGKSGFILNLTTGLNDKLALQYREGNFKSEDHTVMGMTTYAKAVPIDLDLLYKVNPNLTLITGYEHSKISYGDYVSDASRSAFHVGVTGTHKLNDKTSLFATLISGKDVSLKEAGVSYKMTTDSTLNVSYAERQINNMDVKIPAYGYNSSADYKMKGITCMVDFKL